MSNKRNRIIITGASGFIGGHIVRKLSSSGYDCVVLLRDAESDLVSLLGTQNCITGPLEKTLENTTLFEDVFCVIHCAARVHQMHESASDPMAEYMKINRDLAITFAERSLAAGVERFIFLSTVKVMGDNRAFGRIIDENEIAQPSDPYGVSKLEAEKSLEVMFKNRSDATCTILRFPMVYGEGNKGNMAGLLKAASKKIPLPIKAANGKRSMVYVGNIADAVLRIVSAPVSEKPVETFYLSDGVDYSSSELYTAIYSAMNNGKHGVFYVPAAVFKTVALFNRRIRAIVSRLFEEYRFSSELFQKRYSWNPPFTLEQSIGKVVAWYRKKHM